MAVPRRADSACAHRAVSGAELPERGKSGLPACFGNRCVCTFAAGIHFDKGKARSIFYGFTGESREGMEIVRAIVARAGASAFVVDLVAGSAIVRPPRPFRGQATLKHGRSYRSLWRSTIRMPFLGAASINPQGSDLHVDLDPGYDFFDPGPDFFD